MRRRHFLVGSVALAAYTLSYAKTQPWLDPDSIQASIKVGEAKRPINRAVIGVGLMYPPLSSLKDYLGVFSEASVRLWSHADAEWWSQFEAALVQIKPSRILAFNNELSRHSEKIFYASDKNNNLYTQQQVKQILLQIQFAIDRLKSIGAMPPDGLFWEIWNEPEFLKNGAWQASDMAKYANDIGVAVLQNAIPVKILVPLNMGNHDWNKDLCSNLNPNLVDGLVNHYYYEEWHNLASPQDDFLARAGGAPLLARKVTRDKSLVEKYGKGRWSLHCSEWNVHPPDYSPPFYISRDMAVAMYALDAIKIYLEAGLASAQFFLLANRNQHFSLVTVKNDALPIMRPTGALLSLMHQHLHGDLLETMVTSDGYELRAKNDFISIEVPYVNALAARNKGGSTIIFVANKHRSLSAKVQLKDFRLPDSVDADVLVGDGDMEDVARLDRARIPVQNGQIRIPASSIAVVRL